MLVLNANAISEIFVGCDVFLVNCANKNHSYSSIDSNVDLDDCFALRNIQNESVDLNIIHKNIILGIKNNLFSLDNADNNSIKSIFINLLKKLNVSFNRVKTDSRKLEKYDVFVAIEGKNFDGNDYVFDAVNLGVSLVIASKKKFKYIDGLLSKLRDENNSKKHSDSRENEIDVLCGVIGGVDFVYNEDKFKQNIDESKEAKNATYTIIVLVDDTLKAYGDIANYYRNFFKNSKFIGVTGSVGKTTTKNLLSYSLKSYLSKIENIDNMIIEERNVLCGEKNKFDESIENQVYASEANLNNEIGVPYNILNIKENLKYGVIEVGMRAAGEIDYLSKILEPDIAIITNISPAHLEFFESVDDIAKAKAEIFHHMKSCGCAIIPRNDQYDILYDRAMKYVGDGGMIIVCDYNSQGLYDEMVHESFSNTDIEVSIEDAVKINKSYTNISGDIKITSCISDENSVDTIYGAGAGAGAGADLNNNAEVSHDMNLVIDIVRRFVNYEAVSVVEVDDIVNVKNICNQYIMSVGDVDSRSKSIKKVYILLCGYRVNEDNSCNVAIAIIDDNSKLKVVNYKLSYGAQSLIKNSLFVFAVGVNLGLDIKILAEALYDFTSDELVGRGKIIVKDVNSIDNEKDHANQKKFIIIDETYNCGVDALRASLKNLLTLPFKNIDGFEARRKVAIIGEMRELGESSKKIHKSFADILNKMDIVATVGGDDIMALNNLISNDKNFGHFANVEGFLDYVKNDIVKDGNFKKKIFIGGDVVLIKGARANKLELIIDYL